MPSPVHYLLQQNAGNGGMVGLMNSAEFILPLDDAGNGAVNMSLGRGVGAATFTRATAAATKLSTGLWKLDVASGTARSSYIGLSTAVGAYGGYLAEGARTNLCLQSRDLSNASWTKVNTTGAKDQTGIDGVANSASSLTATLGGGTCLQTIIEAATDSTLSMFIKRITGTGTITIQQGASTSEISAQVNSTTYTQISLDATVLNPAIGIALGTNGDKIAVDCVQFENGAFASTPIPTTTVAVTRNADVLSYPFAGNGNDSAGTAYIELSTIWSTNGTSVAMTFGNTNGRMLYSPSLASTQIQMFDGTAAVVKTGLTDMNTGSRKRASSWGTAGQSITGDGAAVATGTFDGSMSAGATIELGNMVGSSQWFGTLKNIRLWQRQLPDATLQAITA